MTHDPNEYSRLYQKAKEADKLIKKLEIAIKALEYYAQAEVDNSVADEALEKIKD